MFLWHLKPIPLRKIFSQKICCAKFTFRRSAKLALYGSKNECARTDTVFLSISEACDGKVSLLSIVLTVHTMLTVHTVHSVNPVLTVQTV